MVARRKQVQIFGNVLEKRFEAKQTRHMKFSSEVAQVLKILNRAINIAVRNVETTLEVHTKVVEEALEIMKLTSAESVASLRVKRTEEQTVQIENTEKLTPEESISYRSLVMK